MHEGNKGRRPQHERPPVGDTAGVKRAEKYASVSSEKFTEQGVVFIWRLSVLACVSSTLNVWPVRSLALKRAYGF